MINCNEEQKTNSFLSKEKGNNLKNVIKLDSGCIRTALSSKGALPKMIRQENLTHDTLLLDEPRNSGSVITAANNPGSSSEEDIIKHGSILKEHCLCCTPWSPVCGIVCASFHEITFEPDPRSKLVRDFGIGKFQVYIDMDDVVACALVTLPDGPLLDTYFGFHSHYDTNAYTSSTSCLPLAAEDQPNNVNVFYHDGPTFFQVMVRPPSLNSNDPLFIKKCGKGNDERFHGHCTLKGNVEKTSESLTVFSEKNCPNLITTENAENGFVKITSVEPKKQLLDIVRSQSLPCLHGTFLKKVENIQRKDQVSRRKLSAGYFSDFGPYSRRLLSSLTLHKKKNLPKSINEEERLVSKGGSEATDKCLNDKYNECYDKMSFVKSCDVKKKRQSDPGFFVCDREKIIIEKDFFPNSSTDVKKNALSNVKTNLKLKEKKTYLKENNPQYSTFLFRIHNPVAARQLTRFTMEVVDARKKLFESNQRDKGVNPSHDMSFGSKNAGCNTCIETLTSLPFDSNKIFEAFLLSADAQAKLVHEVISQNLTQHVPLPLTGLTFKGDELWKPALNWYLTKSPLKEPVKNKDIFSCTPTFRIERLKILSEDTFSLITNDMANSLVEYIPPCLFLCSWKLGYCTKRDGLSFSTFFRCLTGLGPCVFFICDTQGTLFGAFCSVSVYESSQYYGTGECFVFTFKSQKSENMTTCKGESPVEQVNPKDLSVFLWTKQNSYFVYSDKKTIAFGGGEGYAITVDSNFLNGSSSSCITYGNSCLSTSQNFLIRHLQVWYFSDM